MKPLFTGGPRGELAVRSEKFAFELSAEFPLYPANWGFGENFAPELLDVNIRLVSAVRFQVQSREVWQCPLD
jgi:hypothetical protein